MSFVVKIVDRTGGVTWLAHEREQGERLFGSRKVAEIFEVPLAFLCDPANVRRESRDIGGRTRRFYAFTYGDHEIWGATAAMVVSLAQRLNAITPAARDGQD